MKVLACLLVLMGGAWGLAASPVASGAAVAATRAATQPADVFALSADEFFNRAEVKERIKRESVDVRLLETAIFQQSKVERAALKLPLFKHSWALNLMARRHSTEMGALQFFDHVSPTPANATLDDRLKNVGMTRVMAGENIAVLPAKEMGSGHYIVHDGPDGTENLTDEVTGKKIDYYTYEDLAKTVVTKWMNSPPHRANMVRKDFLYLGVGVARGGYDQMKQDSFYMTQNFSSGIIAAAETKAKASVLPPAAPATTRP
jgi:uncharacterized protein YkwD